MATVPTGATTATIPVLDPDQADLALAVAMSKTATTEQHASNAGKSSPDRRDGIPAAVPAKEAKLADDEMMIAIEVGGQHQAYWIRNLSQPGSHLVNDMVGGLAFSITYCDQTDFARVFSDPGTDKPLKLRTAGWMKKQLALQVGSPENIHLHDDKMIPLDDYPFVRVPFGQWRSEHPDGLVYVGGIDWEAGEETRPEK